MKREFEHINYINISTSKRCRYLLRASYGLTLAKQQAFIMSPLWPTMIKMASKINNKLISQFNNLYCSTLVDGYHNAYSLSESKSESDSAIASSLMLIIMSLGSTSVATILDRLGSGSYHSVV